MGIGWDDGTYHESSLDQAIAPHMKTEAQDAEEARSVAAYRTNRSVFHRLQPQATDGTDEEFINSIGSRYGSDGQLNLPPKTYLDEPDTKPPDTWDKSNRSFNYMEKPPDVVGPGTQPIINEMNPKSYRSPQWEEKDDMEFSAQSRHSEDSFAKEKESIGNEYPALAPHLENSVIQYGLPTGPDDERQLEFYHPWDSHNPNPGRNTIEVFNRKLSGEDLKSSIAGDLLHRVGSVDPTTGNPVDPQFYSLREQFANARNDSHKQMDKEAFERDKATYGGDQTFEQWDEHSRKDAYVRAALFPKQNPEWEGVITPEMAPIVDKMKEHLKTPQTSSDPFEAAAARTRSPYENRNMASVEPGSVIDKLAGVHGERYQTWPEKLVRKIADSAQFLGDYGAGQYQLGPEADEKLVGSAAEVAGALVYGPMPIARKAAEGTLGSFGGIGARTADKSKFLEAVSMAHGDKVVSPEEIWKQTGWFRGWDDHWRYEIPGTPSVAKILPKEGTLPEWLHHPELYEAYPWLKNYKIKDISDPESKTFGRHNFENKEIQINVDKILDPKSNNLKVDTKDVLVHEIQHAIQKHEGFINGTNTQWAKDHLMDMIKTKIEKGPNHKEWRDFYQDILLNKKEDWLAGGLYRRNPGEVEANLAIQLNNMRAQYGDKADRISPMNYKRYLQEDGRLPVEIQHKEFIPTEDVYLKE